jgi:hypothetical protein
MAKKESPQRRTCGAMAVHYALLEIHPEFRKNQRILAEATVRRRSAAQLPWKPIAIPVVVHVLYHTDAENISDDQIHTQIEVLNRDFRGKNPDMANTPSVWKGLAGDAGIQFSLATVDPTGKTTAGIDRVKTKLQSFPVNSAEPIKFANQGGADAWPRDKYLNLWVGTLQGGILGYAQFPGGPPETDGVAILNTAFGTTGTAAAPYNLGRTATHEIAHWLNLRHIWGDEPECAADDFVDDTPLQGDANFGKPKFPHISCNNGPNGDMFMNYMDYVDDDTMFMFTVGQVNRMHAALETMRSSFLK